MSLRQVDLGVIDIGRAQTETFVSVPHPFLISHKWLCSVEAKGVSVEIQYTRMCSVFPFFLGVHSCALLHALPSSILLL